jgi:hypothetical protein
MDPIERLLAEREINRQLLNYCRAMDRCDAELGYQVFHADAELDYGEIYRGRREGFVDWAMVAHAQMEHHLHRISNVYIEVDGPKAGSESYVEAVFRMASADGPTLEMRAVGRYVDRWEERDGVWAIASRAYLHTTDSLRPLENEPRPVSGSRDPSDLSYEVLSL